MKMFLKILNIFAVFITIGLTKINNESEHYIEKIRHDYCLDYCANECKEIKITESDKTCTNNNGRTVVTDKYKITLFEKKYLTLTWKTNLVDLTQLKKLNSSENKTYVYLFSIEFNKKVTKKVFFRSIHYMEVFNIYYLDEFRFMKNWESDVYVSSGPSMIITHCPETDSNLTTFYNDYLSEGMNNLTGAALECRGTLILRNDIFNDKLKLEDIYFINLRLINLNAETFKNLPKLRSLYFQNCSLENQSVLRSTSLQNSLKMMELSIKEPIKWNLFENYTRLQLIKIDRKITAYDLAEISKTILTSFIYDPSISPYNGFYYFNIGINGKRCPEKCSCKYDIKTKSFLINCARQSLTNIPDLPIPIAHNVTLDFEGNKLTKLPNTRSKGYNNLRQLHLANNYLSEISIDQLPQNISLLDIRNNSISTLDPRVAKFLLKRKDETSLLHSGIFWKCNCNNEDLLTYLDILRRKKEVTVIKDAAIANIPIENYNDFAIKIWGPKSDAFQKVNNPVLYHHLKGPCPTDCTCCVNGTRETQFIINCTGKALETIPHLPSKILGDSMLLLNDNPIEFIPTLTLRNSTLSALHLKNTSLTRLQLDQLPANLKNLDIRANKLTGLDDELTQFISNLREVQLSGNPWQCSCKFTKFLQYLREKHLMEYNDTLENCSGQKDCPDNCICCKEDDSLKFIVNCSSRGLTEIPPIPISENVTLDFSQNQLTHLKRSFKIKGFNQLKELHLKDNRLIELEYVPDNIQFLDIRNNNLLKLSNNVTQFLSKKSNLSSLTLFISGNLWDCHCSEIEFFRFTKSLARNIKDLCLTQCTNSKLLVNLEEKDVCPPGIPSYVIVFTSFIMFSVLLSFLQCSWKSIRMWLYEKSLFLRLTVRSEANTDTKYDCFLAYCHKDSHLVKEYVERLENGRTKLRLCFYERDWLAGEPIPDCICSSVENSKCTVIIMTSHFLKSVWGRLEFRLALHATSKDPNKRLIVIVYPGVENFDQLDNELQSYMKLNTYLIRTDANFWNKLIYALPHKTIDRNEGMEMIQIATQNSLN